MSESLENSLYTFQSYLDVTLDAINEPEQYNLIVMQFGITKGLKEGVDFYRPYYMVALQLWLDTNNNIISAEGVKFNENKETVRRYLMMQRLIDTSNNLTIEESFTVDNFLLLLDSDTTSHNQPSMFTW